MVLVLPPRPSHNWSHFHLCDIYTEKGGTTKMQQAYLQLPESTKGPFDATSAMHVTSNQTPFECRMVLSYLSSNTEAVLSASLCQYIKTKVVRRTTFICFFFNLHSPLQALQFCIKRDIWWIPILIPDKMDRLYQLQWRGTGCYESCEGYKRPIWVTLVQQIRQKRNADTKSGFAFCVYDIWTCLRGGILHVKLWVLVIKRGPKSTKKQL